MHTLSCLFQRVSRPHPQPPSRSCPSSHRKRDRGQTLVIFAVSVLVLIFFAGLAVDAGSLYLTYGQLKRGVDAAVVAAANEFKRSESVGSMSTAALEVLELNGVADNPATPQDDLLLKVYICDADGDGVRDASLATDAPEFYLKCPDTTANEPPRKLVHVEGNMQAPLWFLGLLGFNPVTLHTTADAEAAAVDIVLVFDISESMASTTVGHPETATLPATGLCTPYGTTCPYVDNYDPSNTNTSGGLAVGCNVDNSCEPLLSAKNAAKALISHLYPGYDQVGIVTFDHQAVVHAMDSSMTASTGSQYALSDLIDTGDVVEDTIDDIYLHDDPPLAKLMPSWRYHQGSYNPVNPEDRDGDGSDVDNGLPTCFNAPTNPLCCDLDEDRWDTRTNNPADPHDADLYGWGGVPCDDDAVLDSFNWVDVDLDGNGDVDDYELGLYSPEDDAYARAWLTDTYPGFNPAYGRHDPDGTGTTMKDSLTVLSTCTGCGIRAASNVLRTNGRQASLWVIVFLTDGGVNLSDTYGTAGGLGDTPNTGGAVTASYPDGFCRGGLSNTTTNSFWPGACMDSDFAKRYCIDTTSATCPPGSIYDTSINKWQYSVLDYALDMTDETALTTSTNPNEPLGNEIAIYSIALGTTLPSATASMRYMAAVGDDGNRDTDPCSTISNPTTSCGQYYFAEDESALTPIFEDIASRIYTRITD